MVITEEQRLSTAQRSLETARAMLPSSVVIPQGWGSGLAVLDNHLRISAHSLKMESKAELLHRALNDLEVLEEINSFPPEYRQQLSEAALQIQDTIHAFITRQLHFTEWQLTRIETHLTGEEENVHQWSKRHNMTIEDTEADFLKMAAYSVIKGIDFLSRDQKHGRMTQEQENLYFDLIRRFKEMLPTLKHLDLVLPPTVKNRIEAA